MLADTQLADIKIFYNVQRTYNIKETEVFIFTIEGCLFFKTKFICHFVYIRKIQVF